MNGPNVGANAPITGLSVVLGWSREVAANQESEEPQNEAAARVNVPMVSCKNAIIHFSTNRRDAAEGATDPLESSKQFLCHDSDRFYALAELVCGDCVRISVELNRRSRSVLLGLPLKR